MVYNKNNNIKSNNNELCLTEVQISVCTDKLMAQVYSY